MAELAEGTYMIVSVYATKAIHVNGDATGENINIWNIHSGDGQIWALSKPEGDLWQILCSLSGKSMGVDSAASGQSVKQQDDTNDIATQRWRITDTGGTVTYNGKSYSTYTINVGSSGSLGLDVERYGTEDGANIAIYGVTPGGGTSNQQWFFVPMSTLSETGFYKIGCYNGTDLRVSAASMSQASGEKIVIASDADIENQIIAVDDIDPETFAVKLKLSHSGKFLDWGGTESDDKNYVYQNGESYSEEGSQWWLPVAADKTVTYNDTVYPLYEIRNRDKHTMEMSIYPDAKISDKHVYMHSRVAGNVNQLFFFIKTEGYSNRISAPGKINEREFSRTGAGSVTIGNLSFASQETKFQGRYKVRYYTANKKSYTDSKWKCLADDSTSRDGWGNAWAPTLTATPVDGVVTFAFNRSVTLSTTDQYAEIFVEIRTFRENYIGTSAAHGDSVVTTICVYQNPEVSASSCNLSLNGDDIGILATLTDSMNAGCEHLVGRLVDADGNPVTDYVSTTSMSLFFSLKQTAYRIPTRGESLKLEYSMLSKQGSTITGTLAVTFTYTEASLSLNPTLSYSEDDSESMVVSASSATYMGCYIEVPYLGSNRVVQFDEYSSGSGAKSWYVMPPLNIDATIKIVSSNNGTSWTVTSKSCRIDSHLFIWNWISDFASIIVNSDAPPSQKRVFQTNATFSSPANRRFPVSFATRQLSADASITGVLIDHDAVYVSSGPLPQHSDVEHAKLLAELSGRGIHPVYRTPYGDWYYVAIESVDVSKDHMSYSNAVITQKIVED